MVPFCRKCAQTCSLFVEDDIVRIQMPLLFAKGKPKMMKTINNKVKAILRQYRFDDTRIAV